jgi:hypothetical protein
MREREKVMREKPMWRIYSNHSRSLKRLSRYYLLRLV